MPYSHAASSKLLVIERQTGGLDIQLPLRIAAHQTSRPATLAMPGMALPCPKQHLAQHIQSLFQVVPDVLRILNAAAEAHKVV